MQPRILAFAGSLRKDSFNKKVVRIAARDAEAPGAQVTLLDLRDYPLPVYDGDLEEEQGLPENARKRMMIEHDGFLISGRSTTARSLPFSRTRSTGHRGPSRGRH